MGPHELGGADIMGSHPRVIFAITARPVIRGEIEHPVPADLEVQRGAARPHADVTDHLTPPHRAGTPDDVGHVSILRQHHLTTRNGMPDQDDIAPGRTIITGRQNRPGRCRVARLAQAGIRAAAPPPVLARLQLRAVAGTEKAGGRVHRPA